MCVGWKGTRETHEAGGDEGGRVVGRGGILVGAVGGVLNHDGSHLERDQRGKKREGERETKKHARVRTEGEETVCVCVCTCAYEWVWVCYHLTRRRDETDRDETVPCQRRPG